MKNEWLKDPARPGGYIIKVPYQRQVLELLINGPSFRSIHRKIRGKITARKVRGRMILRAYIDGKYQDIHRVVMKAKEGEQLYFLDDNTLNCYPENLAFVASTVGRKIRAKRTTRKADPGPIQEPAETIEPSYQATGLRFWLQKIAALLFAWKAGA